MLFVYSTKLQSTNILNNTTTRGENSHYYIITSYYYQIITLYCYNIITLYNQSVDLRTAIELAQNYK